MPFNCACPGGPSLPHCSLQDSPTTSWEAPQECQDRHFPKHFNGEASRWGEPARWQQLWWIAGRPTVCLKYPCLRGGRAEAECIKMWQSFSPLFPSDPKYWLHWKHPRAPAGVCLHWPEGRISETSLQWLAEDTGQEKCRKPHLLHHSKVQENCFIVLIEYKGVCGSNWKKYLKSDWLSGIVGETISNVVFKCTRDCFEWTSKEKKSF